MIKKLIALALVIIGAFIILPCGFGLWNENIGVRGQISFAENETEDCESSQIVAGASSDGINAEGSEKADDSEPTENPEPIQPKPDGEDSTLIAGGEDKTVLPQVSEPLKPIETPINSEQAPLPAKETNGG